MENENELTEFYLSAALVVAQTLGLAWSRHRGVVDLWLSGMTAEASFLASELRVGQSEVPPSYPINGEWEHSLGYTWVKLTQHKITVALLEASDGRIGSEGVTILSRRRRSPTKVRKSDNYSCVEETADVWFEALSGIDEVY